MAYTRTIPKPTCKLCPKKLASVEVFNARGGSLGYYCMPCGRRKLKELHLEEERQRQLEIVRDIHDS